MTKTKKGVSDIVITVSMILVAIVAVGVISAFVVPMIRTQLGKSTSCIALREHFKVRTDLAATCYDSKVNNQVKLSIQRGSEKEDLKGFQLTVIMASGEAVAYQVYNDTEGYSTTPGLPTKGGARAYTFDIPADDKVEKIAIASILETEDTCDPIEYAGIRIC
jgi:hypothetical protein